MDPSYKARVLSMKYTDELDDLLRPARSKGNVFIIFKKTHKNVPKIDLKAPMEKKDKILGK